MMRPLGLSRLVEQCRGCCLAKVTCEEPLKGSCIAFIEPAYQWRKGECWGRCASPWEMAERYQAIADYSTGENTRHSYLVKAEEWRDIARSMSS